jgi:prepilin-type N-terminal cleavage/methylation domain-containing protein
VARSSETGFTLAEVLVAMGLFAIAAIALAHLLMLSSMMMRTSRLETVGTIAAADKLEQLRALAWRYDASGQPISDLTSDLSIEPPTSGGSGLAVSPAGSLAANTPGYADFLDSAGQWVGTGSHTPAAAVYVRRWNVADASVGPIDGRLLQVVVVGPDGRTVSLATLKVRKSR